MSADARNRDAAFSERAESDLRRGHAALLNIIDRHADGWDRPILDGWTPAEVVLHLLLVAERTLEDLRAAAAAGVPDPRTLRKNSFGTATEKRLLFMTWRLPRDLLPLPGTEPQGVIIPTQDASDRATRCIAALVHFFREHPEVYLRNLRVEHARIGAMDPAEWMRFLRISIRHYDLKLKETE